MSKRHRGSIGLEDKQGRPSGPSLRAVLLAVVALIVVLLLAPLVVFAQGEPTPAVSADELTAIITAIAKGQASFGWIGAIAALLAAGVKLYRMIPGAPWDALPAWARLLVVFVLSFCSAGLIAGIGGGGLAGVVAAGLLSGLSAIGVHQTVKSVRPAEGAGLAGKLVS